MKTYEKYLIEKKEIDQKYRGEYFEVLQGLSDATDGLRDAYYKMGKFDDKLKVKIKKIDEQLKKLTMTFNKRFHKKAGANEYTGFRSL